MAWLSEFKNSTFQFRLIWLFGVMAVAGLFFTLVNPLHEPPPEARRSSFFSELFVLKVSAALEKTHRELRPQMGESWEKSRTNRERGQWERLSGAMIFASKGAAEKTLSDIEARLRRLTEQAGAKITDTNGEVSEQDLSQFCFYYRLGEYRGKIAGALILHPTLGEAGPVPPWRIRLWHQEWVNLPFKGSFEFDPAAPN
jgi:hypothetical protein